VVRLVNREANPHDCNGPSSSKARQVLADMAGKSGTEIIQRLPRQLDFDITLNAPSFFERRVVRFEVLNRFVHKPFAFGADGVFKCVD